MIIFMILAFFIFSASVVAGIPTIEISLRSLGCKIVPVSYNNNPPGLTLGANLSMEGWLSTMAVSKQDNMGELILLSEMIVMQFAVPPRISGPYEGIHEISLPSTIPE